MSETPKKRKTDDVELKQFDKHLIDLYMTTGKARRMKKINDEVAIFMGRFKAGCIDAVENGKQKASIKFSFELNSDVFKKITLEIDELTGLEVDINRGTKELTIYFDF